MERIMTEAEERDQQDMEAVETDTADAPQEEPIQQDEPIDQDQPEDPRLAVDPADEDDDSDDEPAEEEPQVEATLETVVEAVLFASDEPVKALKLTDIAEAGSVKQIRECIRNLNKKYREGGFSFRIEKIAGGYQMMTLPVFNVWLSKLMKVRTDSKLTPAALETLAIISYKQPIIRADVEAIRGVASGEVIRNLMYKGLVKIVGRAEVLGRPMQYGTTKKFLEVFGLNSLKDLPDVEELKKPQA